MTNSLRELLGLADPVRVDHERNSRQEGDGFVRETLHYSGLEGDAIPAYLFTPTEATPDAGVVVFHQHAGEFHLGKSEVAGDAGSELQAFGPALAQRGVTVLAPDALTFEDRRSSGVGVEPADDDWLQHYNALGYRLIDGDVLMRKCLDDAQRAVSVLLDQEGIGPEKVGVCGHSYGGSTAMYLAAVDERCRFACVSGSVCSFGARKAAGTGINMFELVPGIAAQMEIHDVLGRLTPRPTLIVSATDDPYSQDAEQVVARAGLKCTHLRAEGGHPLDRARFEAIVEWLVQRGSAAS